MNPIFVIGCDKANFTVKAGEILRETELLLGSKRLLELAKRELKHFPELIELDADSTQKITETLAMRNGRRMTILASGDPLCCGIGGTLRRLAPEEAFEFHPSPTAFQQAFARLGVAWENMELFNLHGKPQKLPFRRILRSPLSVIYCDSKRTARQLSAELIEKFPLAAQRRAAVGCDLGMPNEYVFTGTLIEISQDMNAQKSLSLLILLPSDSSPVPPLPLGLPNEEYLHFKEMITHPEIRAIVLSKLRPAPGVMWDVGAGSGSVGLEAAGLCRELTVNFIEKNSERISELNANCQNEGLDNIVIHPGNALSLIPLLPNPDRVFIGGGGVELKTILQECFNHLNPGGIIVVTAVLAESVGTLIDTLPDARNELIVVNISRANSLGGQTLMKAENPITIAVYHK
ncbi:MAG: precorrin-6y C5,15-methyltransferase (decarboxylating) subunit CbiE [Victivallales bacterium]|jgi:precorrin-6Y C5,15-methyltransferase (decarboxylating)|nr:precorrin-6y C5,15-methyltransferase (decarboxylating) subunit CbiE [Victivallales bacterium]